MDSIDWGSVLERSIRSPSPDNSQPFVYRILGDILEVEVEDARVQHVYNFKKNLSTWVSLGCTWETWAQVVGPHYKVELLHFDEAAFFARFRISRSKSDLKKFFPPEILQKRRCYRGVFQSQSITAPQKKKLLDVSQSLNAWLCFAGSPEFLKIKQHLIETDQVFWNHPQAVADTFRWIRWTPSQMRLHRDGFSRKDLGANLIEFASLLIPFLFPRVSAWFYRILKPVIAGKLRKNLQSSGGFILVNVEQEPKPLSLIEIGRLGMRCWLTLTELGYACQPFSTQSYLASIEAQLGSPEGISSLESLPLLSSLVGKNLQLPWLFRFGTPSELPEPSLRREIQIV